MKFIQKMIGNKRWFTGSIVTFIVVYSLLVFFLCTFVVVTYYYFYRDEDRTPVAGESRYMGLAIYDEINSVFLPQVDALNSLQGNLSDEDVRMVKLDSLKSLPGVVVALCLVDGNKIEASDDAAKWGWLVDSLSNFRGKFRRTEGKLVNWMQVRAKFELCRHNSQKYFIIADAYDSNGNRFFLKNKNEKIDPSKIKYLFALVVDSSWIRNAVVPHINQVMYSKDVFVIWALNEKQGGEGILMAGDTIWWHGMRKWDTTKVAYSNDWGLEPTQWFNVKTVWFLGWSKRTYWKLFAFPGLIALIMIGSVSIFLLSLVQLRKQWLSRQIALEQIAHSIKTPVARLKLNADTLLENRVVSPETEREIVQAIGRECGRLDRAVQNAALAIQEGSLHLHKARCELNELCNELVMAWKPVFTQNKIGLELQAEDKLSGDYDREMFAILFDNLIDNALRHTRLNNKLVESGDAKVLIQLRKENDKCIAKVIDSGNGVDPKDRKKIFERFERGSDRALTGTTGLGLGLALSKEIAEAHGGTISVENTPSGGACFTVTLPTT